MARPLIIDANPYISDSFRKDSKTLLDETGGNTGNLAFRYAVNEQVRKVRQMSWKAGADTLREAGDIIVLPLANQLGDHTDLDSQAALLTEIGLPVVGIGLGAQANAIGDDVHLSKGTLRWLKAITDLRPSDEPNIGVRGKYTKLQIEKMGFGGRATVVGCPSNFINLTDDIAALISAGFSRKGGRIAIAAGIPYVARLTSIEQQLADIVTLTDGAYIVQHGLEMVQIARNEFEKMKPGLFEMTRIYVQPYRTADEFRSWCRKFAIAFLDVRFWMDFLKRFDFVVGTRFHGVMLAIQAGVPAGCISHDSRTFELCETMGIPVCRSDDINGPITQYNIRDLFKFDAEAYREKRRSLATAYSALARNAGLDLKPSIGALVA